MATVINNIQCPKCYSAGALRRGFFASFLGSGGKLAKVHCAACGHSSDDYDVTAIAPNGVWPVLWTSTGKLLADDFDGWNVRRYLDGAGSLAEARGHPIPNVAILGPRQFAEFQDNVLRDDPGKFLGTAAMLRGEYFYAGMSIRRGETPGVFFKTEEEADPQPFIHMLFRLNLALQELEFCILGVLT